MNVENVPDSLGKHINGNFSTSINDKHDGSYIL